MCWALQACEEAMICWWVRSVGGVIVQSVAAESEEGGRIINVFSIALYDQR